MSDHDATPDPIDKAYAQAEALLGDERARADRRARVLGAVAAEPATTAPAAAPAPRPAWRRGGWLVAASVAGVSVLVAVQALQPAPVGPPAAPPIRAPAVPAPEAAEEPPPPPTETVAPAAEQPPVVTRRAPPRVRPTDPPAAAPPAYEASRVPDPPPAAAPAASPSGSQGIEELVVSASRAPADPALRAERGSPAERGARLRAAAAAGRAAEVRALLAEGVPVDAADDKGETALMRSVLGDQPAVAAILRRHGADIDRRNRAGNSARDMATAIGDAELDRALGLSR